MPETDRVKATLDRIHFSERMRRDVSASEKERLLGIALSLSSLQLYVSALRDSKDNYCIMVILPEQVKQLNMIELYLYAELDRICGSMREAGKTQ